jgi:hypothetical protein
LIHFLQFTLPKSFNWHKYIIYTYVIIDILRLKPLYNFLFSVCSFRVFFFEKYSFICLSINYLKLSWLSLCSINCTFQDLLT